MSIRPHAILLGLLLGAALHGPALAADLTVAFVADSFGNAQAPALAAMRAMSPYGFFIIGDFDHSNPGANVTNAASALEKARAYHGRLYDDSTLLGADYVTEILMSGLPLLARVLDDHEVNNDVSSAWPYWAQTLQAFLEFHAVPPDNGFAQGYFYQALRIDAVQFILLDLRTHRDDIAGPTRTTLGDVQKAWISTKLAAAAADRTIQWTVLVSTVPFNPNQKKLDSWSGYPLDRQWLLDQIAAVELTNVLVVSGDCHWGSIALPPLSPLAELNIPHLNRGFSDTCRNSQGDWTLNSTGAGPGFGLLTLRPSEAVMSVYNDDGSLRLSATVPADAPPPPPTGAGASLTVSILGPAAALGHVSSSQVGIDCGYPGKKACTSTKPVRNGMKVTLSASPIQPKTAFGGWGGACAKWAMNRTCVVTALGSQTVTATFVTSP